MGQRGREGPGGHIGAIGLCRSQICIRLFWRKHLLYFWRLLIKKICADIYENIRVAKNCASLIFPQIFSQILAQLFAEINSVLKIPQIFAILFAVIIAMRKYYRKTKRKFLQIANKSAKRSANESAK